jgi:putative endonuclease
MSNYDNSVLYIGVTNNLVRRVSEHIEKQKLKGKKKPFTFKYNCNRLVYYEDFNSINQAIEREKQLKNWKREWKNELVERRNPNWSDLSRMIGAKM